MKRQKGGGSGWFAMPGGLRGGGRGVGQPGRGRIEEEEEEGGLLLLI